MKWPGMETIGTLLCVPWNSRRIWGGRAMGAGFVYGLATLKVPHMQLALERAGYQLLGFAPGCDRELVAPGVVKRV